MNQTELIQRAIGAGFANAAVVPTSSIPFEPAFLVCCEDNLCGNYGVNYTCPPDCGTPEQMKQQVLSHPYALLLQTIWEIDDPMDTVKTKAAKKEHNAMTRRLIEDLRQSGYSQGFMIAASGCNLCQPCAITEHLPCRFPTLKASCMSAYCVFVKQLAEQCGMEYDLCPGLVAMFGMYVFTPDAEADAAALL